MSFSKETISAAWSSQGGLCAYCGKTLSLSNREPTEYGAWNTHHRKPKHQDGTDTLHNCVIFCRNQPESCHFNIGHGGISWDYYSPLKDSELPYLFYGKRPVIVSFIHLYQEQAINGIRRQNRSKLTRRPRRTANQRTIISSLSTIRRKGNT